MPDSLWRAAKSFETPVEWEGGRLRRICLYVWLSDSEGVKEEEETVEKIELVNTRKYLGSSTDCKDLS